MTNLAKIKRLYLCKPSICKTFWTTLVFICLCSFRFGSYTTEYLWIHCVCILLVDRR